MAIPSDIMCANRPVDDIRIRRGNGIKDRFVDSKVLCENGAGSVSDPIVDVESGAVMVSYLETCFFFFCTSR